ncbi:unnamed protein product [Schistocephalus solidus]|uniref:Uncharacterized protein n=1 Tax=Schistocephalus solidus TaxID=70667 RepID=A0A183TBB2_SCHSO|nr:unnamed protein product [Schistocephalus solidus]
MLQFDERFPSFNKTSPAAAGTMSPPYADDRSHSGLDLSRSIALPKRSSATAGTHVSRSPISTNSQSNELANRLANLSVVDADTSVESRWCQLKDTVQSTALDVLGRARR